MSHRDMGHMPMNSPESMEFWVLVEGGRYCPEWWDGIVTLGMKDGERATAVFPSIHDAEPLLDKIRTLYPDRKVGVTPQAGESLIDGFEHRTDIEYVLVNASSAATGGEAPLGASREDFINELKEGAFTAFIQRN